MIVAATDNAPATEQLTGSLSSRECAGVGATVASLVLAGGLLLWSGGESVLIQHLPDDAFYYFVLAEKFAHSWHWTFDGVAPATGFHLLWGYLLVALNLLVSTPSLSTYFLVSVVLAASCYGLAAAAMAKVTSATFDRGAALVVPFVSCGCALLANATMAVEAPWVLLCASTTYYLITCWAPQRSLRATLPVCLTLGLVGTLARSDFGLVPAGLCLAQLTCRPQGRRSALAPALAVLAGAAAGVVLLRLHTEAISGASLQHSAEMKLLWSARVGHSTRHAAGLIGSLFTPFDARTPWRTIAVLSFMVAASLSLRSTWRSGRATLVLAGVATMAGYVLFYRFNSQALQPWYVNSFAAPSQLVLAPVFAALVLRTGVALIAAVVSLWVAASGWQSLAPIWPHQVAMRQAGLELSKHREVVHVGAWNAGIVNFFASQDVINLDGLVNDQILEYARDNRLAEYFLVRQIDYVLDYSAMLTVSTLAQRGGYGDGTLRSCLHTVREFAAHRGTWSGTTLVLSRVDLACIEQRHPKAASRDSHPR